MRQLWEFLRSNPILFFVLAAWIAGAIGNALRAKTGQRKVAEERARRGLQSRPAKKSSSEPDRPVPIRRESVDAPPIRRPTQAQAQPLAQAQAQASGAGSHSPDEIAAEMRRILGLDVDITPAVRQRSEPVRREPRRLPAEPEPVPTVVAPTTQARHLSLHDRPHVGERLAARKQPSSGSIGEHDKNWGTLGGRIKETEARPVRRSTVQKLIDLSDLKRTILAIEILGPPVCLRGNSEMRSI